MLHSCFYMVKKTIILPYAIRIIDYRDSAATKYIYLHSKSFVEKNVIILSHKKMP